MITIIEKPSVYLVGQMIFAKGDGLGDFLDDNGCSYWTSDAPSHGEYLVEVAGRLCYDSFATPRPGGNEAYIGHILEVGHGSVLEHAVFGLIFAGVSRSLTHELVRHRVGLSYSQRSQRYVDESDIAFVIPPALIGNERRTEYWLVTCQDAARSYQVLLETAPESASRKAVREAARSVLPNCCETKIYVTGNARAWRHFLELRGSLGADAEIRRLALAVLPVLRDAAPNIFGDYQVATSPDAIDHITTPHVKV